MTTLILLTALSAWNYEGFVADSRDERAVVDPRRPIAPDPFPPSLPSPPPPIAPEPDGTTSPTGDRGATPAVMPPRPPAAPPAAAVEPTTTRWRLADSSGQVWEHADPNWLSRWVASRNAAIQAEWAAPRFQTPVYRAAAPCATGYCPR